MSDYTEERKRLPMAASFERKEHDPNIPIWVGKYRNLHNLPHWHVEHELIACRGGSAELMLDGVKLTVSDGMAAFCPSGSVHHMEAQADATLIVAQISMEMVRFLGTDVCLKEPVFRDRYGIYDSVGEILADMQAGRPYCRQRANAVMVRLLIDIFREEEAAVTVHQTRGSMHQYRELLSAIDTESEFMTFTDAANRMHMSQAHFSRYFKRSAGMTFSEYLNLVKVDKAIGILKEEPTIATSDLALRCGFNTLRSFNRVFRKTTGYSPKQLPGDFSLHIRQYAVTRNDFDPTLSDTVTLT